MKNKKVKYQNKEYKVVKYIHYRLEWYDVELRDLNGNNHRFLLKETDLVLI